MRVAHLQLALLTMVSLVSIAESRQVHVPAPQTEIKVAVALAVADSDTVVVDDVSGRMGGHYLPFTLNKNVPIFNASGLEIRVDVSDTAQFAARITSSGTKISGFTLRGGTNEVVDIGPGTVDNCKIVDVAAIRN